MLYVGEAEITDLFLVLITQIFGFVDKQEIYTCARGNRRERVRGGGGRAQRERERGRD